MNLQFRSNIQVHAIAIMLAFFTIEIWAAPLTLENTPLFTTNAVKPNLILSIDNSGSMDSEVLLESNDGALWWNVANQTFVSGGAVNFNIAGSANSEWKKFVYLFPNGTGTGTRVYSDNANDHYAIPPLPQYHFLRSSAYNRMYYDPNVTYDAWANYGLATFGNLNPASAPSDPITGPQVTIDLTQNVQSDLTGYTFRLFTGTAVPAGTEYSVPNTSGWQTLAANYTVPTDATGQPLFIDWGMTYFPATYYIKATSGTYTINGTAGDCATPDPTHYPTFEKNPWTLSGIDALGPDGACLAKVEIKPATASYVHNGSRTDCASASSCTYAEEIQNFANWYGYYRKRHLTLRAGMGHSFDGLKSIRTGLFTINNRIAVTMWDVDVVTQYDSFYQAMYNVAGNSGGTPNRQALDYAGQQFMRTDAGAPITQACQKNFTLHFTDGYSTLTNPATPPGNADGGEGAPYADSYSDTFADIAMKYYTSVLRTDLAANQVPTAVGCNASPIDPQLDCNDDLHMNTFTVGLAGMGTIFGVTHNDVQDAYASTPVWPDTNTARDPRQIDDLYHAAVNGRGEMFNASSPQDLRDKLTTALQSIQSKVGAASAVTFNTATLETNSAVYLAFFNSGNWSGDLVSFDLDGLGNVNLASTWSAASLLDNANPSPASRVILTHNGSIGAGFQWANLSPNQQADLNLVPGGNGQKGLDFIRGDRSNEGSGKFRVRGSVLSDIVHSSPVFVGKPNIGWPDTLPFPTTAPDRYLDFRSNLINNPRNEVVYFGSNDGMLHGVQASDGKEILAYIPGNLYSTSSSQGLHYLADPQYQHRYYVDLSPTVSDVFIGNAWHTILVGAGRSGGRGIFALDITDPTQFSESNAASLVWWEFTHNDIGGNLGFTYSKPTIAMLENGRWAAIFGNGYNDTGTGQAKLFIVFIDGGLDGVWTDGTSGSDLDYIVLSTGVGSAATPNGLATPAVVDINGNGAADRVYAGDLLGNMWAFDLSDATTLGSPNTKPAWKSAYLSGSTPVPLFTATDASNNPQPITSKPATAFLSNPPAGTHFPNVMVFFGTGKYLEQGDLTTTNVQSFYGVWDDGQSGLARNNSPSKFVQQTLSNGTFTDSDGNTHTDLRLISDNSVNYSNKFGWYIDLNLSSGERVVVNPIVRGSLVFFNTWIPNSSACSSGGTGFLMSVEQFNGGEPDAPAFDVNADAVADKDDFVISSNTNHAAAGEAYVNGLPAQSTFLSNKQYTPGTGSKVVETRDVADLGGPGTGRLSWQQLSNN
ncbi:MAG: hypothetical protein L0Y38_11935 [Methylococcaceae bacterium]|nr:hypothetical protein [Methylococcaceae bacterium]